MPNVTNLSMADVVKGKFPEWANENTVLVQLQDVDHSLTSGFANVKNRKRFVSVYQFRFDDTHDEESDNALSDEQAKDLALVLQNAKNNNHNVVVHCHAGLCRSGAVTEVALMYGFDDVDYKPRLPNTLVKKKLRLALGLTNTWEE